MRAKHHIIYIPGLADTGVNRLAQATALFLWQPVYGVSTQVMQVGWASPQDGFETKLQRITDAIDKAHAKGRVVSLVACSAGGSLAICAFASRPNAVRSVVTIAGAHGPVEHASNAILAANPILKPALQAQPAAIVSLGAKNRGAILVLKPAKDTVVQLRDMNIPDAHYLHLSTKGHLAAIAAGLTKYSSKIIAFIKRQA